MKLAILSLAGVLFAGPLFAAEADEAVNLDADQSTMTDGVAVAVGHAKLTFRGMTVAADKIEYTPDKRVARTFVYDATKTLVLRAVIDLNPRP